jgi:hypothetical protein
MLFGSGSDEGCQDFEGVEGLGVQLRIVNVGAKGIFNVKRKVDQAEGIDESTGEEGLIGSEHSVGLLDDIFGDMLAEFLDEFFVHGCSTE